MTDAERDRLRRSRGPWSLYEVMPGEPIEAESAEIDYHVLLTDLYRQRAILDDLIAVTTTDAQAVENADALARQGVELLQKDIAATKEEITAMRAEHDLVAKHVADLEAKLAELRDAAEKTEQANRAAASELARLQLDAIRRIDQRTSKVARAAETY
jgi:septal ring factor EnvC (AmiA/AmiB activator)